MSLISQDLIYFLKVSAGLTLDQAARELGVTQPALSRALHRLEEELKQKLFSRQRRQLILTKAGHELKNRALVWQGLIAKDLSTMGEKLSSPETTVLRIGFHSSIGVDFLASALKPLCKAHPELLTHFHLGRSVDIYEAILRQQVEIGVLVNATPRAQLVLRRLGVIQSHIYGNLRPGGQLFVNPAMVDVQRYLRRLRQNQDARFTEVLIPDYDFMAALVKNDLGAALLPEHIANRFSLKPSEYKVAPGAQFELSMVYLSDELSSTQRQVARHLEEILRARFSKLAQ